MKKSKKLIVTTMSVLALVGLGAGLLTACGGNNGPASQDVLENYTLTWNVPDHASVTVDDYEGLPTSVPVDSTIAFAVTVDDGFDVDSVKANNKKVSLKNERYTIAITRDTVIDIEASEAITDLKVTSQPTKLTYVAGDEIDLTGMVVEATFVTSGTKVIPYGDGGYSVYPTVFAGGETSFEITYKKETIVVNLSEVVQYKVVIDANGGEFTPTYLATLEALNLNNYKYEDGVITFTYYNNLTSAVPMPKDDEVTREQYALTGWSYEGATISNMTAANVEAKASWQYELVKLASCKLLVEDNTPYLIIKGKFNAANEVYLYLYEGNDNVELKGDTYTGTSGEEFEVKFDLTRLSSQGDAYRGKWMDIRFNAKSGDQEESMEIFVNATSSIEVDTGEKIAVDGIAYIFATYESRLKVYFLEVNLSYTFLGHSETVGGVTKDYLRIQGNSSDSAHANKYAHITVYNGSNESEGFGANIDAAGNFTVEYDLSEFDNILKTNIFFHITIYEDSTKGTVVWGGTNQNITVASVYTPMPQLETSLVNIHHAAKYEGASGLSYYIGYAWDGLMLYVVNEGKDINVTYVSVEERSDVVYYVVTGTCTGYTSEDFLYGFYFQHINNIDALGEGDVYDNNAVDQKAIVDASGNFEISCPVSTLITPDFKASTDTKWGLLPKYYVGNKKEATDRIQVKATSFSTQNISKDGVRYSIYTDNELTWNINCLVLEKI